MMRAQTQRHGRYWVYIVQASDHTYYTGSTNNLERRLTLHNAGNGAKYLRGRGPVRLVYVKAYRDYKQALRAERDLKNLTREQKHALIHECDEKLSGVGGEAAGPGRAHAAAGDQRR